MLETVKNSLKLQFRQTLSAGFRTTVPPSPSVFSTTSATLWEYLGKIVSSLLAGVEQDFRKIERVVC